MTSLEVELLRRIKSGDDKAFELVFKSYYPSLCSYAFDLLKTEDQAEEIVQETLIKIWELRNQIEIGISVKSYLFRSVHNRCINYLKHSKTIRNLADKYTEDILVSREFSLYTGSEFGLDYYFYEGLEEDIDKVITDLPEQCRRIFQLSRFERQSHQQIALKLDISVNTVKTQISRALEKLRRVIGDKIAQHQMQMDSDRMN